MPNDDSVQLDTDGDGLPDEEEDRNQMASSMTMRQIPCESIPMQTA